MLPVGTSDNQCLLLGGKTESTEEFRLLIKTKAELFSAVETSVIELHSYQQPQITAVPIVAVSDGYASWIRDNVGGPNMV